MGSCQGAVTVILRTYIGETSSTIIASLPPEQREKSTLKYTAFFVTFTVCTLSVLAGPGKLSLSTHMAEGFVSLTDVYVSSFLCLAAKHVYMFNFTYPLNNYILRRIASKHIIMQLGHFLYYTVRRCCSIAANTL